MRSQYSSPSAVLCMHSARKRGKSKYILACGSRLLTVQHKCNSLRLQQECDTHTPTRLMGLSTSGPVFLVIIRYETQHIPIRKKTQKHTSLLLLKSIRSTNPPRERSIDPCTKHPLLDFSPRHIKETKIGVHVYVQRKAHNILLKTEPRVFLINARTPHAHILSPTTTTTTTRKNLEKEGLKLKRRTAEKPRSHICIEQTNIILYMCFVRPCFLFCCF